MESPKKFIALLVLSALLGAGIWFWDKHRTGFGSDVSEPIVVDVTQPLPLEPIEDGSLETDGLIGGVQPTGTASGVVRQVAASNLTQLAEITSFEPGIFEEPKPEVESFDAYVTDKGIVLEWVSGAEDEALGYRIYRIAADGTETLVADMTTAAFGDGELYKLVEPGNDGGQFVIDRVNRDLTNTRLPLSATARMVSPPEDGLHVVMIQAEGDEAELDIGTEARNLFIIGFKNKPVVEDRTDPDSPRVLVGESISLRGEQAVYFKADSYSTIYVHGK